MKYLIIKVLRRLFLALTLIFLFLSLLVIVDMMIGGSKATPDAFIGMLIIASFFAIPYFVIFKKYGNKPFSEDKTGGEDSTLKNRRCTNCNSSQLQLSTQHGSSKRGYVCDHCGSYFE